MRLSHDAPSGGSATPIYDALYAEYSSLFRTLPGDRTGEEELRFQGFGTVRGTGTGHWDGFAWRSSAWRPQPPQAMRPQEIRPQQIRPHDMRQQDVRAPHDGRVRHGQPPAALPPAPRDGRMY